MKIAIVCILQHFAVSVGVVNDMKRRREEQRSGYRLPLGLSCDSITSDATPSPSEERHPQWGVLPSRPPPMMPSPVDTPTYEIPPTSHTPSRNHSYNSIESKSVAAAHQQHPPPTNQPEGLPSMGSWSTSGESYDTAGHTHIPHPPSSGHVTDSSYENSVFAYGSLPSGAYTDSSSSSQATPSNSQTTPSSSVGRSIGSEQGVEGSSQGPRSIASEGSVGLNILHFSYAELSEATGGFTEGMVGIGAFGTVFKATVRGNGPYAIKKLHTVSMGKHGMTVSVGMAVSLGGVCLHSKTGVCDIMSMPSKLQTLKGWCG